MSSPFPKSSSSPGRGHITVKLLPHRISALESITYQYPLKLISPHPTSAGANQPSVLVFLLSYGGGLVGGDQVDLSVTVHEKARLSIVTQGHTKVFNSIKPEIVTRQSMTVEIRAGAALCLLPDPVQPFERSVYEQTQIFRLKGEGASLVLLDWVTQGRLARGEDWSLTHWSGRNEVWIAADDLNPTGTADGSHVPTERLLVRDSITLDGVPGPAQGQTLKNQLHGNAVIGTLVLRGPLTSALGEFFLKEFELLPRLGSRDFERKKAITTDLEHWRVRRLQHEKLNAVLWSAARVRGCVVVKFGAASVEAGREWIGAMLLHEGSVESAFGAQALMCLR
ncbi:urease accessory protein UreD [Microdochium trichocladiopsis]|uniref:Urease accessory protein UreD n=1 Tax=Microdochium trichocladiopsis TaxID=1682393 RepID=A0A9P8YBD6_9PEZI|nr:urease accessory protein UreD [Microdochium trichocladiopsis]KAH7033224.1 urease accessory protein UreD [Microdochium trichocladiopsis]